MCEAGIWEPYDPDFAGQLKIAWDTKLKKNDGLILVLCGSVSSCKLAGETVCCPATEPALP